MNVIELHGPDPASLHNDHPIVVHATLTRTHPGHIEEGVLMVRVDLPAGQITELEAQCVRCNREVSCEEFEWVGNE